MRTVAIVGGTGQLGNDCQRVFKEAGYAVASIDHDRMPVEDLARVRRELTAIAPEVVVNTAAMHNVEICEADPSRAYAVNGIGPRNLAITCGELRARLLHISTDYVFDGSKDMPYTEDDAPGPLNVYGNTKLSGEFYVRAEAPEGFVIRTSALYGSSPCRAKGGLNFVGLMLKLARERGEVKVVRNEMVSPTYTFHLARQLLVLAEKGEPGVYHATSSGECSWYDFAREIFALTGTDVRLNEATSSDFPVKVRRPAYSVLDNARARVMGLDQMPDWRESLVAYLEEIGESRPAAIRASD